MKYSISEISYRKAMNIFVTHHYLHRKAPCSFAFGLFDGDKIIGAIAYGTPSSAPLRSGICGPAEKNNVIELTRLWIDDCSEKNAESFLIGNTLRLVDKEIVVSFAEIDAGHVGTVYQATNWIYTGLSAKRTNWTIQGVDKHCQTLADKYTAKEIRAKYGDSFSLQDRPRKHRYIFFNCGKRRRKYLLSLLKYPVLPYPKLKP
jgi:hypothetical protein